MLYSASKGAIYNILINIPDLKEKDQKYFKDNISYYFKQIENTNIQLNKFLDESIIKIDV